MPGFHFLDNILSFQAAQILSAVFATGSIILATILALISLAVTIANFSKWSILPKLIAIVSTIIIAIADIAIIIYANDGRYIKQSWQNEDNYTYFGTMNNDLPHGWGKLFDKDENIYYIGEFSNGKPEGNGKFYKKAETSEDEETTIMFVWKEGNFLQGKGEGHVVLSEFINGKPTEIYNGEMSNDEKCGYGISHEYRDDKLYKVYDGGWAFDKKYGFGIETEYGDSGNKCARYTGTFWDDRCYGKHIYEFISGSNDKFIRVGWTVSNDEDESTEYAFYLWSNRTLTFWGCQKGTEQTADANLDEQQRKTITEKWPMPEKTIWD